MSALEQQIPEGYKHTEAGVIPEDWRVEAIAKNMKLINGYGFKPHQWSSQGLPIIRIQNLNSDDAMFNYFEGIVEDKFHVKKGDILFAWSGSKGSSFGARVWQGAPAILNQHIFRVVPNQKVLTTKYSFYVLRKVQEQIEKMAHGFKSSFVHVKKEDLSSTPLPIPSKEEQTAIANALSDVDGLLTELENLLDKKQAIKTATMQQLLTGKTRLPQFATYTEGAVEGKSKGTKPSELGEIPEDWDVVNLGEVISFKNGAAHEDCIDEYGDFVLVNSKFVSTEGRVRKGASECRQPACKDDLLMVMSDVPNGKAIAKCFIVDQDNLYTVNQRICIIKPLDEMNPTFLLKVLSRNPYYLAFDDGAKQTNLRREDVLSCPLVKPSKEEQTAIATILSDMDNEILTLEQRLAKTRQIKQGMMQQLLTGRTRLPFDSASKSAFEGKQEVANAN